jgi:diguanylate cyclase (GGDEF)-like protein/PAS domain S-box-containing protein
LNKNIVFNNIERTTLLVLVVWTGIFTFSYITNVDNEKETVHQLAVNEIRSNLYDVLTFQQWISSHGGVYIPITEKVIPNPALANFQDRDIETTTGKQLTLINTPYLLKKLSNSNRSKFNAHMTSLNPLNPANSPDEWEKKTLQLMINGQDEVCEIVEYNNAPHMRLMQSSKFNESCASCHTEKEYKNGDVLGGITVSVPMQPYLDKADAIIQKLTVTHGGLWFLGLLGILFTYKIQKKYEYKRKINEDSLRQSSVAFNNLNDGLIITDPNMEAIAVNEAFTNITGYDIDDLLRNNSGLLKLNNHNINEYSKIKSILDKEGRWQGEIEFRSKNDNLNPFYLSINSVRDDDNDLTNYIFVYSDIRERKKFERTLEYQAQHDHLTKLPNRMLLNDRIEQALYQAERHDNKVAILFLDLDDFKNINDSVGHNVGDNVLVQATQRLKSTIRKGDTLARHGGDEFIIVMSDFGSEKDISILCDKLLKNIEAAFLVNGESYLLGVSIGISIFPDHGKTVSDLISKADIAMYEAKADGKNDFRFYSPELNKKFLHKIKFEAELHNAIKNDEFVLHYQPQVSIETSEITGVECLVRWEHPVQGLVPPGNFIPEAEELGLMIPIGEIIFNKACAQMRDWFNKGIDIGIMAVNISGSQASNKRLHEYVTNALSKHEIPSNRLELEITEDYIMQQDEQSVNALEELRNSSVQISIDDFGTGYSSLSYLKKLPINKIKIDRNFVEGVPSDPHDKAIINAVIAIGKSLDYKVIAEGVENEEQLNFLREEGCTEYQGYYFSKPLPAEEFENMLQEKKELADDESKLISSIKYS